MADRIELPVYYEDQILGAADLNAAVDLSTGQLARHERYLHTWGIADGLQLQAAGKTTAGNQPYIDVTCTAGVAIDGWGREIVVVDDELLNPLSFQQANVFVKDQFHPVFLAGIDENAAAPSLAMGGCFNAQTSRRRQSFVIEFGRPGSQFDLERQTPATVLDGPGEGGWKVLLGYVKYDSTLSRFVAVADSDEGVGRRYAGVQADEVVARSGRVVVRSRSADRPSAPALALDEAGGGTLVFGLQDGAGGITPLLTVDSKGNLDAAGTIGTAVFSGSGIVSDGMLVPLPGSLTEEKVAQGKIALHIHVSPFFLPGPPNPTVVGTDWIFHPRECRVDNDRRVICRFSWKEINNTAQPAIDQPGVCSYMIVAYVPAEKK
jgi:hypothetical protein